MPIVTVNGQDFYNYQLKEAPIIDHDPETDLSSMAPSARFKDSNVLHFTHLRKKQGKCKRFRKFLYNKEDKTSCNRSGKHWGALIFYFAFFLGLILLLFFCYFYGVDRSMAMSASPELVLPPEPKFYISPAPTFAFVPINVDIYPQPFVWYKSSGKDSPTNRRSASYVTAIEQFYKTQAIICQKHKVEPCAVDPSYFGPCGQAPFGYNEQKPCFFLKLNSRTGWRPDAYHSMYKVPASMPTELKDNLDLNRETLCIHCSGANAYDARKIGKIVYYPEPCYNDSFFPFSNGPVSSSPTIAIQLKNTISGFVVELTCQLFGLHADGDGEYRQTISIYIGDKKN